MEFNFQPSTWCDLNLLTNDGMWYGDIGCRFEENLESARGYEQDSKYEWAITAKIDGNPVVIAQSKNWRKN